MSKEYTKEELLTRIKELEAKLKKNQKYGLVWESKDEDVISECDEKFPILKRVEDKSIRGGDGPMNYLIEGDNYHALKVLQYTHKGKVDVIYIDPPYNTGNKDFIYNDSFVDKEDGYRHSKWLSFMERRLKLAKELLKDTGLMFISIDYRQQANLELLLKQIFGENNFKNNITVQMSQLTGLKMSHVGNDNKYPKIKENLMIISKTSEGKLKILKQNKKDNGKDDELYKYSKYYSNIILNKEEMVENWEIISLKEYFKLKNILIDVKNKDDLLKWKIDNADILIYRTNNDVISKFCKQNPNSKKICKVISPDGIEYIKWDNKKMLFLSDYINSYIGDIWLDISTINLNKEISELKTFDNGQKPLSLIKRCINSHYKPDIILDFFAGSGTTGHAVLELNKQDGGNRQFILVTNNGDEKSDHKIAEKITYERLKRVMKGYVNKKGEKVEGLSGNLDYLRCEFIEKIKHQDSMRLKIAENCLDTILFKENNDKIEKQEIVDNERIYTIARGYMANLTTGTAIYHSWNDEYLNKFKNDIEKIDGPVNVYLNPFIDRDEFSYLNKINIKNIQDII